MVQVCKGIHQRFRFIRHTVNGEYAANTSVYDGGQWCAVCGVSIIKTKLLSSNRCPCCTQRTRLWARFSKKAKEQRNADLSRYV